MPRKLMAPRRGAKAPRPQTASILRMQMSGRTHPQGQKPCGAPHEPHLGARARTPGCSAQLRGVRKPLKPGPPPDGGRGPGQHSLLPTRCFRPVLGQPPRRLYRLSPLLLREGCPLQGCEMTENERWLRWRVLQLVSPLLGTCEAGLGQGCQSFLQRPRPLVRGPGAVAAHGAAP